MFEQISKGAQPRSERSPENRLAEEICSVGYDLARIYCAHQGGGELLERRCNLSSDQEFVYRARWYLSESSFVGARSDLIFFRETDQVFRLHIITRTERDGAGDSISDDGFVVDGRRSLEVWQQLIERIVPPSDNVLDDPNGFEWKRESINYVYSGSSLRGNEQRELSERRELLTWVGGAALDPLKIEALHGREAVPLAELVPRKFALDSLIALVDAHAEQISMQLEPWFNARYEAFRSERLSADLVGDSLFDMKKLPLFRGVSMHQLQLLGRQAEALSGELGQVASRLMPGQQTLHRLHLGRIELDGSTATRLALCFNAFDSALFREQLFADVVKVVRIAENPEPISPEISC